MSKHRDDGTGAWRLYDKGSNRSYTCRDEAHARRLARQTQGTEILMPDTPNPAGANRTDGPVTRIMHAILDRFL